MSRFTPCFNSLVATLGSIATRFSPEAVSLGIAIVIDTMVSPPFTLLIADELYHTLLVKNLSRLSELGMRKYI
jgi:hypothetical protein